MVICMYSIPVGSFRFLTQIGNTIYIEIGKKSEKMMPKLSDLWWYSEKNFIIEFYTVLT